MFQPRGFRGASVSKSDTRHILKKSWSEASYRVSRAIAEIELKRPKKAL